MKAPPPHISTSFEEALHRLKSGIAAMAGVAESQLVDAMIALEKRDRDLAESVIARDRHLDEHERSTEAECLRLLVLRQPVADDLREVISALKIAAHLERIGDLAANIAKRATVLMARPPLAAADGLPALSRAVRENLHRVIDSYMGADLDEAHAVWNTDADIDSRYTALCESVMHSVRGDDADFACHMHVLFIAKNLERIGDHATNIAELVHYLATGKPLHEDRPKADRSAFAGSEE